jgi:hypothetical protein
MHKGNVKKPFGNPNGIHKPGPNQKPMVQPVNSARYWEHPTFQFLSKRQRLAQAANNVAELERINANLQKFMEGKMSEAELIKIEEMRKDSVKSEKAERRKQQKGFKPRVVEEVHSQINTAELKKRIFNPQTSPQNMMMAFEKLPADERKRVAKSLTPYLRSKIPKYLESKGL